MEEFSAGDIFLFGDAGFYRSLARALLHIAEGRERLILLDKKRACPHPDWAVKGDARNVVLCHHTLQLKRSDAKLLWQGTASPHSCSWEAETWDIPHAPWDVDKLDVKTARDTVFLTGSAPIFVELARVAVLLSRDTKCTHHRLYALERDEGCLELYRI